MSENDMLQAAVNMSLETVTNSLNTEEKKWQIFILIWTLHSVLILCGWHKGRVHFIDVPKQDNSGET